MLRIGFVVIALIFLFNQAEARHHHYYRHHVVEQPSFFNWFNQPTEHAAHSTNAQVIGGRPNGCPNAYCGCSASLHVFGKIIPSLNLASNWGKFPSASPASGMVAYRNHHVFVIESVNSDGTVVAHDGNSGGHLTRIHTVSLRGYRVVDPHG